MSDLNRVLHFYSTQGIVSDSGAFGNYLDDLPDVPDQLCRAIQGLLIHIYWMDRYGAQTPKERRQKEVNLRTFNRQLSGIIEMDRRQLGEQRILEKRLVGTCRDFTLFFVAIMRHKRIPARARAGFGIYFMPNHFEDHWVAEYWNRDLSRWVMVDAQLDDFQKEKLAIQFDSLNMPPGMFITGGDAWRKCRAGNSDPSQYGIFDMHGLDFIAGDLIRDFLALNKIEILPWDNWPSIISEKNFTPKHLEMLDKLAELTADPDNNFDEIRATFETNEFLRPPTGWHP